MESILGDLDMKLTFALFVLFPLGLFASFSEAESFNFSPDLSASIKWIQGPVAYKESKFDLVWNDKNIPFDPWFGFGLDLFMPAMGHGSSPVKIEEKLDGKGYPIPGQYSVTRVYFTMTGAWQLRLTAHFDRGDETRVVDLSL